VVALRSAPDLRAVGVVASIAKDAGNLTPNPFPSGKGNNIKRDYFV
jgi:hypothetical protein